MRFMDFLVKESAVIWLLPSSSAELEHLPASLSQNPDTAVLLRIQVFWDVTLCHWVNVSQHVEEA
jgi:hypothetical protein